MYVRTKRGIGCVDVVGNYKYPSDFHLDTNKGSMHDIYSGTYWNDEKDLLKEPSYDLMDLIEVGDYVNGYYVEDVKERFINIATGSNYFQKPSTSLQLTHDRSPGGISPSAAAALRISSWVAIRSACLTPAISLAPTFTPDRSIPFSPARRSNTCRSCSSLSASSRCTAFLSSFIAITPFLTFRFT